MEPGHALEAALVERWRGTPLVEEEPEPEPPVASPAPPVPSDGSWRGVALVLIVAGIGVGTGLLVSLLGDDDDEEPGPTRAREPRREPRPARPAARPVRLTRLPGATGASGTVRRSGERVVLRLRGLPPTDGHYGAWLYNSIADARSIARFGSEERAVRAKLPADPARYRFLDVSREPPDDNPNHSGASVLRAPVRAIDR